MQKVIVTIVCLLLIVGCGKKDESVSKKAGAKVGETLTDFASGVGKGVDKKMEVKIELSKSITDSGVSTTVAKLDALGKKALTVYFIADKPYKSKLIAKAINSQNQEIGRASANVELAANDAKYINFEFHQETDTQMVTKYVIDAVK
jgi:hypothetical protein